MLKTKTFAERITFKLGYQIYSWKVYILQKNIKKLYEKMKK